MSPDGAGGVKVGSVTPLALRDGWTHGGRPLLLDVREADEYALVAIEGARHIPLGELHRRMAELEAWRERDVVVYCHHGMRSLRAAWLLARAGFSRVRNLEGGIDRWALEVDRGMKRY